MPGPLEGVKVLEVAEYVALPSAGAILADWGAEVIKVENTRGGDPYRGLNAFGGVTIKGPHVWFEHSNRNKKSIAVDLWQEEGQKIIFDLVKKSDVFMTNFTIPVIKRFNLAYENISNINPHIVYASLTGYGRIGPERDVPGYDFAAFWAKSGIMAKLGEPGTTPPPQRGALGDNLTAGFVAGAISAALYAVEKTGEGQAIDFSLYNYGVWGLSMDIVIALNQNEEIPRTDRKKSPNPLWNSYQTKDGSWLQLVNLQSDRYWPQFCKALNLEYIKNDPKFNSHENREKNCKELIEIIDSVIGKKTYEEISDLFDKAGEVIFGKVQTPLEVTNDPQAQANDFFKEIEHPSGNKIKFINSPAKFSKTPASIRMTAPELGQHTEECLLDIGHNWEEIIALKEKKVIL